MFLHPFLGSAAPKDSEGGFSEHQLLAAGIVDRVFYIVGVIIISFLGQLLDYEQQQ